MIQNHSPPLSPLPPGEGRCSGRESKILFFSLRGRRHFLQWTHRLVKLTNALVIAARGVAGRKDNLPQLVAAGPE